VQPIPNWFNGEWQIRIGNTRKWTLIKPLPVHVITQAAAATTVAKTGDTINNNLTENKDDKTAINFLQQQDNDQEIDFVLSAKQSDHLFKKKGRRMLFY
jgi:hypothetical protein